MDPFHNLDSCNTPQAFPLLIHPVVSAASQKIEGTRHFSEFSVSVLPCITVKDLRSLVSLKLKAAWESTGFDTEPQYTFVIGGEIISDDAWTLGGNLHITEASREPVAVLVRPCLPNSACDLEVSPKWSFCSGIFWKYLQSFFAIVFCCFSK
eukprot:Platyproteum_vivax@DN422_c0_g1_i1.p1